jgi:uncharacterized protein (TIGR02996 family)
MTEADLLRAVCDAPDDDALRLVYADWLEEHDDLDRAAFIRAQVRLARLRPWDDGHVELDVRCRELERLHPEWLGWLAPFVKREGRPFGWEEPPFDRGFPARLSMRPADLVDHHDRLFETAPIRGLSLDLQEGAGYADLPGLRRLAGIEFRFLPVTTSAREAARCLRRLDRLERFGVGGCRFRDREARSVVLAPPVLEARSVRLAGTPLPERVERALAAASFPNLRRLERVWVSDLAWLRAGWLRRLEDLTIDDTGNNLRPEDAWHLNGVLPETDVVALKLGEWPLDEEGAQTLGATLGRCRLEALNLSHIRFDPALLRALLRSDGLAGLRAFFVTWARPDVALVRRLAEAPIGVGLRVCGLDHVDVAGLGALASGPALPELASLRLGLVWSGTAAAMPAAVRAVLDAGTLPRLVSLTLCDTRPTPAGRLRDGREAVGDGLATALARCPGAARLQELRLDVRPLSRAGAKALASSRHLSGLRLLDAPVGRDDQAARAILADRFGRRALLDLGPRAY